MPSLMQSVQTVEWHFQRLGGCGSAAMGVRDGSMYGTPNATKLI